MEIGADSGASMFSASRDSGPAAPRSGFFAVAPREIVGAIAVAGAYYAGVQVGLAFTLEPHAISILWPPNAILLAALLLTRPRVWWLLIAAVLPAHLVAELSLGVPLSMALCWFVSNVAEALLGAAVILRYLGGPPRFDRIRDLSVFLVVGVVFAPIVTSFLDAGFVALIGWRYGGEYWSVWRMRLFSNALATLTLTPLIVVCVRRGVASLRKLKFADYVEIVALLTGICVTSVIVFQQTHAPEESAVLMYTPLPFLMWAAVRRGVSGVSLCVAVVAVFAIIGVVRDQGPFAASTPESAAIAVQSFLVIAAASLMLLAATLDELRYARAVALQQKESLNLALGAAQMGTWEWDIASDRITWRGWQEDAATAETPAVILSRERLLDRIHVDDRASVVRAIDDALEKGASGDVECRLICGDDPPRWVMGKGKVLVDAKGKAQRMIGVHIDMTERKSHEMQARVQREQLAHLSRVATLGELSGAIAHELNQPLTAMLINAQVALRELKASSPDLAVIEEILGDIASEDARAGEVIRRLRALFRKGAVHMRPLHVNECIKEVLALEHSDLVTRNVVTDLRLAERIPAVLADHVQLQQVLLNLIVNACDATAGNEPGNRRLRIGSASNENGGVDIEIGDNGKGLEDLEKPFEPFFSTKDHGIGLGLPICRTIVAAHRGRLWASNNAAGGATFHISLPAASRESFAATAASSPGTSSND